MKNRKAKSLALLLSAAALISLSGCAGELYTYDGDGNEIPNSSVDYIQEKYTADECRAEAERLFGTSFEIVSKDEAIKGLDHSVYTLRSEDIPFEFSVFSDRDYYEIDGDKVLFAHAYCDYYEQMMNHKDADASALAGKYGLEVKREGQSASVSVSSYDQLESVYEYLNATNELYDFTVVESQMTNILRDIRNRPTIDIYLDNEAFGIAETDSAHVIKLYYTINNDMYNYTKDALLPTMQETYIELIDSMNLKDSAVTSAVRSEKCKPALTQLCVNGVPLEPLTLPNGVVIDPVITFDYNWLLNDYYGDIRICAPSYDYFAEPDDIGDDRSFKYLVELLGGQYYSYKDSDLTATTASYMADWWLGGNEYGAGTICQEYIPTMSSFSINGNGINISHYYSKEMWGLENGYGPEDYYVRITPEGLASLLGVTAEADYENGILNLITPEGYFDFDPPEFTVPDQSEAKFIVEDVSINGIPNNANHYIIYKNDGTIIEERTTDQDTYAECEQLSPNVVLLKMHGAGMSENITFFNTETGYISDIYYYGIPIGDSHVVYSRFYTDVILLENVMTGERVQITDGAYDEYQTVLDAQISGDLSQVTITYRKPDPVNYYIEVTETFDVVLP